jgi:hypothetical protein
MENLTCPITCGVLQDPITMPCCGRSVSRAALILCCESNGHKCVVCGKKLLDYNFDPKTAPKSVNVSYMIDDLDEDSNDETSDEETTDEWTCTGVPIKLRNNNDNYDIAKLTIKKNTNKSFKTLLIPVIDRSGSMGFGEANARPITQAKFSLEKIIDLTYDNPHLVTSVVLYDCNAMHMDIDTKLNEKKHYYDVINDELEKSGGTNFMNAFNEIKTIIDKYKNKKLVDNIWNDITSVSVIFMTDGCDGS